MTSRWRHHKKKDFFFLIFKMKNDHSKLFIRIDLINNIRVLGNCFSKTQLN